MPRYIAFLRAVNVGGRIVKMAELKSIFKSVGMTNVETFIASGNVIYSTTCSPVPDLVSKIEPALKQALGFEVPLFIRTDSELTAISARKHTVFSQAEVAGAYSLNIGVMHAPLSAAAQNIIANFNTKCETFRPDGCELFMLLHTSVLNSKFSITKLEKAIGAGITFRNVNTMQRLAKKYPVRDA